MSTLLTNLHTATSLDDFELELSVIDQYLSSIYSEELLQSLLEAADRYNWKGATYIAIIYWAYYYNFASLADLTAATNYLQNDCGKLRRGREWFSWAEFYDDMISGCKRGNQTLDPKFTSIYYQLSGYQMTLIDCVQYPRVFNFALKRDADEDGVLEHIIINKEIKKAKKISLIEGLKRNSKLTLYCGPNLPPAPILCIQFEQNYLFKYFTDLDGIEYVVDSDGNGLIKFLARNCPYAKYLRFFNASQLEIMLMQINADNSRGIDSLAYFDYCLSNSALPEAIESLHTRGELSLEEANKFLVVINAETLTQKMERKAKEEELERQEHMLRLKMAQIIRNLDNAGGSDIRTEIWSESGSSFDFTNLPQEIMEIMLVDLDIPSIRSIFCTDKSMQEIRRRLGSNFYRKEMQKHFLPTYSSLLNDKETPDWSKGFYVGCRKINSWKTGDIKREKIAMWKPIAGFINTMDENWIVTANHQYFPDEGVESTSLRLYDLHNEEVKQKYYPHAWVLQGECDFLESRPGELPTLIVAYSSLLSILRDSKSLLITRRCCGYVTVVDKNTAIIGKTAIKYDIEHEKEICTANVNTPIWTAKYNKSSKMTATLTFTEKQLILMDENLRECTRMKLEPQPGMEFSFPSRTSLTWLNDVTLMTVNHTLYDIRMPTEKLYTLPYSVEYIGAGLGLAITAVGGAQIWDLKRLEVVRTIPLEWHEMRDYVLCNSGHALLPILDDRQRSLWKF